jgi:hypothetical protein
VQGKCWFTYGYVLEKGAYRGQTVVSCPCAVATVELEVFQELPQEANIEVFHEQFRRCPSQPLRCKLEQQSKGVPVSRYGVLARTELVNQSVGEETLQQGLKAGSAHRSPPL